MIWTDCYIDDCINSAESFDAAFIPAGKMNVLTEMFQVSIWVPSITLLIRNNPYLLIQMRFAIILIPFTQPLSLQIDSKTFLSRSNHPRLNKMKDSSSHKITFQSPWVLYFNLCTKWVATFWNSLMFTFFLNWKFTVDLESVFMSTFRSK